MRKKQTSKTAKVVVRPVAKQVEAPSTPERKSRGASGMKIQTAEGWRRQMLRDRRH